jgi:sugar phosphate isomerase/epimerase
MQYQLNKYPSLTKSYKKWYPFKIGTTSFIYPDLYVPNVKMLGPFVDEIELLLFESAPVASLLPKAVIKDLMHLSQDLQVTYNIHLPTDISISDPAPALQDKAVDTLVRILERVAPLSPSSHTLHVPYPSRIPDDTHLRKWQDVVYRNLEKIIQAGVPAAKIAIETLDYSFEKIDDIVKELNLSICMDLGHLILHEFDIIEFFNKYATKTSIIHLHGVKNYRDHLSLQNLPVEVMKSIYKVLEKFNGMVSVEVFSFTDLKKSLHFLEQHWH